MPYSTTGHRLTATMLALAAFSPVAVHAHDVYADDHAPIGVMADHTHKKGEIMLSFRAMHMDMGGSQIGTRDVTPEQIVTTVPNRFFGNPMQPPTLRVVPRDMRTDMYMVGAMYAPSDAVTLMVMGSYVEKEMDHITFRGGMGTDRLGEFTTNPRGIGDIHVSALFPLLGHPDAKADTRDELTLKTGLSIPTGSVTKTAQILTPMGAMPTSRTPYPMQLGSGSYDFEPALTYKLKRGKLGFGAQGEAIIRLERNNEGYSYGDVYAATGWASYRPAQWISLSARVAYRNTGRVRGIDPAIIGPVQTANPDFQGGDRIDLISGINTVVTHGPLAGHRFGIEAGAPVYQNLNGPQLKGNWMLTAGWQKAF